MSLEDVLEELIELSKTICCWRQTRLYKSDAKKIATCMTISRNEYVAKAQRKYRTALIDYAFNDIDIDYDAIIEYVNKIYKEVEHKILNV